MDQKPNPVRSKFLSKQAPITVIGVLVLGVVGSTLYDLLVKPGLTNFGRACLDIATLGSERIRDSMYASAALDPTPVTGLILLQVAFLFLLEPASNMISRSLAEREEERVQQRLSKATEEKRSSIRDEERSRLTKKLRFLKFSFWAIFLPWVAMAFIAYAVHNQSVLLWRTFNANAAQLAPVIEQHELIKLRASFAGMRTSSDYKALRERVLSLSKSRGVTAHDFEPW